MALEYATAAEVFTSSGQASIAEEKHKLLEANKAEKESRIGSRNVKNGANLDDSVTVLEDGTVESNKNKMWNKMSSAEYQSTFGVGVRDYHLIPDEKGGLKYANSGEHYDGKTEYAYMGYGKESPDVFKFGIARGDKPVEARYDPARGGWASGPEGIDNTNMQGFLLPAQVAITLEALGHGRQEALDNRAAKSGDPTGKSRFGSGYTEYYNKDSGFFGDSRDDAQVDQNAIAATLKGYIAQAQEINPRMGIVDKQAYYDKLQEIQKAKEAQNMGLVDRVANTAKGFAKGVVQNLVVDTADMAGEILDRTTDGAVGWDLGDRQKKSRDVSNWLGYNEKVAEQAMEIVHKEVGSAFDAAFDDKKDVDWAGVRKGLKAAFTSPESIAESLGYVASMLVGFGKTAASKAAGMAMAADKLTEAATVANAAGKAEEVAKISGDLAKVTQQQKIFTKQANIGTAIGVVGVTNISAGEVNDQIDEYKKNNNGESPATGEILFRMMPIAVASSYLDRMALDATLSGGKQAIKAVTEGLPVGDKKMLLAKGIMGAASLAKAGSIEAGQEYVQTMAEIFNEQYDTAKWGTNIGNIVTNRDNIVESLTGATMGFAMGTQLRGAAMVAHNAGPVLGAVGSGLGAMTDAIGDAMPVSNEVRDAVASEAETEKVAEASSIKDSTLVTAYNRFRGSVDSQIVAMKIAHAGLDPSKATAEDIAGIRNDPQHAEHVSTGIINSLLQREGRSDNPDMGVTNLLKGMEASGDTKTAAALRDGISKLRGLSIEETKKIYGSDRDFLDLMYSMGSNNQTLSDDDISGMVANAKQVYGDTITEEKVKELLEASKVENIIYDRLGYTGKSQGEVGQDVIGGKSSKYKGFQIHYREAVTARALGDTKAAEKATTALQNLINNQNNKYTAINTQVEKLTEKFNNEVNALIPGLTQKAINNGSTLSVQDAEAEARTIVAGRGAWDNTATTKVAYPGDPKHSFAIKHSDIATGNVFGVNGFLKTVLKEATIGKELLEAYATGITAADMSSTSETVNPTTVNPTTVNPTTVNPTTVVEPVAQEYDTEEEQEQNVYQQELDETGFDEDTRFGMTDEELASLAGQDRGGSTDSDEEASAINTAIADRNKKFTENRNIIKQMQKDHRELEKNYRGVVTDVIASTGERGATSSDKLLELLTVKISKFVDVVRTEQASNKDKLPGVEKLLKTAVALKGTTTESIDDFNDALAGIKVIGEKVEAHKVFADKIASIREGYTTLLNAELARTTGQKNIEKDYEELTKKILLGNSRIEYYLYGEGSADITGVFKFNPTPLNIIDYTKVKLTDNESKIINETVDALHRIKGWANDKASTNISDERARHNNPALNFLGSNMSENVAVALRTAVDSYISNNYTELTTAPEDNNELFTMAGAQSMSHMSSKVIDLFAKGGKQASIVAHDIGKEVMQLLGITAQKNSSTIQENALSTSFGLLGVALMSELGYIKSLKTEKGATGIYRIAPDGLEVGKFNTVKNGVFIRDDFGLAELGAIRENIKTMSALSPEGESNAMPSFEPIEDKRIKIRREDFMDVPESHQKAVKKLNNVGFNLHQGGMEMLARVYGDNWYENKALQSIVGMPEKEDADADIFKSATRRASDAGKERQVLDTLNGLKLLQEAATEAKKPFYYEWFIGRNLRLHIKNTIGNMQADSKLVRWLVQPADGSWSTTVSKVDVDGFEGKGGNKAIENMLFGIVQALDGISEIPSTEKDKYEVVIAKAKELLQIPVDELIVMVQESKKLKHPGHAAVALHQIKAYQEAVDTFEASIPREVDGKTNGFAHKILQFPIIKLEELLGFLRAVGIITSEEELNGVPVDSITDVISENKYGDVYQKLGFNFYNKYVATLKSIDMTPKDIKNLVGGAFDFSDPLALETSVKGALRQLPKEAATEVNYSSNIGTAASKRGSQFADMLMDKIASANDDELSDTMTSIIRLAAKLVLKGMGSTELATKTTATQIGNILNELAISINNDKLVLVRTRSNIRKNLNVAEANADVYKVIKYVGDQLVGDALFSALNSQFGEWEAFNSAINYGMNWVFHVFVDAYDTRAKALGNNITKEQHYKIMEDLSFLIPAVATVDTDNEFNRVSLLKLGIAPENTEDKNAVKLKRIKNTGNDYLNFLREDILVGKWKEPAASTLPILTHGLDASNMVHAVNNVDEVIVPIHDAKVSGVTDDTSSAALNKAFFTDNMKYSMGTEAINVILNTYKYVTTELDAVTRERLINKDLKTPLATASVYIGEHINGLGNYLSKITDNRAIIAGMDLKVGQFVDNYGTMYEYKGSSAVEAYTQAQSDAIKAARAILGDSDKLSDEEILEMLNSIVECK